MYRVHRKHYHSSWLLIIPHTSIQLTVTTYTLHSFVEIIFSNLPSDSSQGLVHRPQYLTSRHVTQWKKSLLINAHYIRGNETECEAGLLSFCSERVFGDSSALARFFVKFFKSLNMRMI